MYDSIKWPQKPIQYLEFGCYMDQRICLPKTELVLLFFCWCLLLATYRLLLRLLLLLVATVQWMNYLFYTEQPQQGHTHAHMCFQFTRLPNVWSIGVHVRWLFSCIIIMRVSCSKPIWLRIMRCQSALIRSNSLSLLFLTSIRFTRTYEHTRQCDKWLDIAMIINWLGFSLRKSAFRKVKLVVLLVFRRSVEFTGNDYGFSTP